MKTFTIQPGLLDEIRALTPEDVEAGFVYQLFVDPRTGEISGVPARDTDPIHMIAPELIYYRDFPYWEHTDVIYPTEFDILADMEDLLN